MVSLKARTAGQYKLRVLLHPESSLLKENPLPELVAESQIRVTEAAASSARSRLSSFWPPQGPVAGTPAGAVIQVGAAMLQGCPPSAYPTVPLHFSHTMNMLRYGSMEAAAAEEYPGASEGQKPSDIGVPMFQMHCRHAMSLAMRGERAAMRSRRPSGAWARTRSASQIAATAATRCATASPRRAPLAWR